MPPSNADPNGFRGLAEGSMIVGQLTVPILLGVWADQRWASNPWGVLIGCVVGFIGAGWGSYRAYRRMNTNDSRGG